MHHWLLRLFDHLVSSWHRGYCEPSDTDEQNYFENFEEVHVTAQEKEETMTMFDKHLPDVETGKWTASKNYNNQRLPFKPTSQKSLKKLLVADPDLWPCCRGGNKRADFPTASNKAWKVLLNAANLESNTLWLCLSWRQKPPAPCKCATYDKARMRGGERQQNMTNWIASCRWEPSTLSERSV